MKRLSSITSAMSRHWILLVFFLIIGTSQTMAQEYEEWSAEVRTSLSFRVNEAAIQPLLPSGWNLRPITDAPGKVSLSLTFMDRYLVLDAQGQQLRTGTSRYMVFSVQARNEASGQSGVMIINGISPEGSGAYEVYQPASVARTERTHSGVNEESGSTAESWEFVAESGDSVLLDLRYQSAPPTRRQSSIVIRSGHRPEFTRTYHIDQASDALGVPGSPNSRIESLTFTATGPLFSTIFDGTEVLTGVTSTPWYHREISIP
jgi:hypothetical protein